MPNCRGKQLNLASNLDSSCDRTLGFAAEVRCLALFLVGLFESLQRDTLFARVPKGNIDGV
jgi:hypothetical protein